MNFISTQAGASRAPAVHALPPSRGFLPLPAAVQLGVVWLNAARFGTTGFQAVRWTAICGLALLLGWSAGCATSGDVKKVDEANRVQDQRLRALEEDIGTALDSLRTEIKALRGQIFLIKEQTDRMAGEQSAITENQERSKARQRKLTRMVEEEVNRIVRFKNDAENDLDKMRLQLGQLEKLLKSPISKLPDKSPADKEFRSAYFSLINGELDVAAGEFAAFRKKYPQDKRGVEALYRRGQAFFLMRRYDHALEPFLQVVEKSAKHPLATQARWMLARALEETGELKLARAFYGQLITGKTVYANDATRRLAFIDKLYSKSK